PAISKARQQAKKSGRDLDVVIVMVGTDEDPQDLSQQIAQLKKAGARVETSMLAAATYVGQKLQGHQSIEPLPAVDLAVLQQPFRAINVGVQSFAASLSAQNAAVIHVDWRPPAGGDEKLMSILERMKKA
ncbi:MAG: hypothetical protein D6814_07410, partial [Calditrichaeota bacterium]